PLRVGPELLLAAGPRRRARRVPALRRSAPRLHGVQPARGRMADREIPGGPSLPPGVADDAPSRAVRTPADGCHIPGPGRALGGGPRPRNRDERARTGL